MKHKKQMEHKQLSSDQIDNKQVQRKTKYSKYLVSFLYFLQGVYLVIPSTTILTYKTMPSYSILGLFSFAILPFSFKFIAAPFVQKYTSASYGRRKTWLIISLVLASFLVLIASNFTQQSPKMQGYLAICLTAVIFMIAIQDISTDALSVKQLNSSQLASYTQCVMQPIGAVFGSLLFLELVSGTLYIKLNLAKPLLQTHQYYYLLSAITLVSAIIIHITYQQKTIMQQKLNANYSFIEVVKQYRYFFNPKYRLCRQALTFLLQFHGIVYFSSSFTVELIKAQVISKDALTTLSNVMVVPMFIMTNWLRRNWNQIQLIHQRTRRMLILRLIMIVFLFFSSISNPYLLYLCILALILMSNAQFFLNSMIINNFSESKFAGLYVTMMASFTNFGNNSTIQLQIISQIGQANGVIIGIIYTIIIIIIYGRVQKWIKAGQPMPSDAAQTNIKIQ